jgi:predicted N-acetyltransferase YhbS
MDLPGGLVLRTAVPGDLEQIGALLTERGEPEDAVDHRLVVADDDAGWSSCAVVVDGDRVVSTATLLDETIRLGGVEFPAGQVELVATDREYEGRGLVRALMGWAHERSAGRGHLAQVMIGIPYFYRRFGYSYAIPIAPPRPVVSKPPATEGHTVREATTADIGAMAALHDVEQASADLRMPHSPGCWRWVVARDGNVQWVVERDGDVVATGRATDGAHLSEVAARDEPAARALLRHVVDLAGDREVNVVARHGSALGPFLGEASPYPEQYYARIPDPGALLEHLRPVLSARLAASDLADFDGEVVLTFFRTHVRFRCAAGEVGPMVVGGQRQSPGVANGVAVAPDQVPPLLFGADGFAGLSLRYPDVYAHQGRALAEVLFPPVRADLLTFYVP